ncbi:MAG: hypothetical protein WC277_04140 [Bacilli bacterium]|jgi:hypothetical protein
MKRSLDLYTDSPETLARVRTAIDMGVSRHYSFRVAPPRETPDIRIGKSFGWPKEWDDIWVNTKDWTVYAYAAQDTSRIRGCCLNHAVTILVLDDDTTIGLRNRILHEILHAEGLDADGMEKNLTEWLPWWLEWLFWRTLDRFRNVWEWQYYRYLIRGMQAND